tara:strand:+ start:667 stop:1446 length:780 start_codon:yes stop_codon:yes gene_type:complete
MGGGGSQTIEQTFNMSAVNKSIYNQITKNTQSVGASQTSIQKMTMNIGGSMIACPYSSAQTLDADMQADVSQIPNTILAMKNEISAEMQAGASAAMEKSTQAGNMQFGDKQDLQQTINMEIENIVDTTVTTENVNNLVMEQVSIQSDTINIAGDLDCMGQPFDRTQNLTAKLAAKSIQEALTDALIENKVTSGLTASLDADMKSKAGGFAEMISAATGPMMASAIASVIGIVMVMLSVAMVAMSPAGQGAMNKASSKYI